MRGSSNAIPRILALPPVGKTRPIRILRVVVLPAPLGPRKPKISPSSTVKSSGYSARFGRLRQKPTLYVFSRWRISTAAMANERFSKIILKRKVKEDAAYDTSITEVQKQLHVCPSSSLRSLLRRYQTPTSFPSGGTLYSSAHQVPAFHQACLSAYGRSRCRLQYKSYAFRFC